MPEKAESSKQKEKKDEPPTGGLQRIAMLFTKDPRVRYLILAPLIGLLAGLFAFGLGTCFGPLLVPIVIIAIPYYMGIKETLKLLKMGLIALIVGGFFMAALYGFVIYDRSDLIGADSVSSSDGVIKSATVSPLKGLPGEDYNFTMTVDPLKAQGSGITVYFRVRDYLMERRSLGLNAEVVFNETGFNSNSSSYYRVLKLPGDTVYFAEFFVKSTNGTDDYWTTTDYGLIIVASTSIGNVMASMLPMTMFNLVLFPYCMIFLMFLSVLWWLRRSRERRMEMQRDVDEMEREQAETEKKAKEAEFACTSCGAPVKDDDSVCPKCGAKFEDEEVEKGPPKKGEEATPKKEEKK